jgi:two-component system LytT family response regulator
MNRVLIAESCPEVRTRMRTLAESRTDIAAIAEAEDGVAAVMIIEKFRPTVVFLSVELPVLRWFEVLYNIDACTFSTVFHIDQSIHAMKILANRPFNTLVKPFSDSCWHESLNRALHANAIGENIFGHLKDQLQSEGLYLEKILVQSKNKVHLLSTNSISHLTSQHHITFVHTHDRSLGYDRSLAFLEERLSPVQFARIHRNVIVKLDEVAHFPMGTADTLILQNGATVKVSRAKRRELHRRHHQTQRGRTP